MVCAANTRWRELYWTLYGQADKNRYSLIHYLSFFFHLLFSVYTSVPPSFFNLSLHLLFLFCPYLSVCLCLDLSASVCLSAHLDLSVCLYLFLSVCVPLSVCFYLMFVCLSVCVPLAVCLSVVWLSVCVRASVYLSVYFCLSVCPHLSVYVLVIYSVFTIIFYYRLIVLAIKLIFHQGLCSRYMYTQAYLFLSLLFLSL